MRPDEEAAALKVERYQIEIRRRNRANARDALAGINARLNQFLVDDDYRDLLGFAELKVLGASSDIMSEIVRRLSSG